MNHKANRLPFYLLICWAIIGSALTVILWRTNQRLEKVNALLLNTVIESNNLANNASEAYKVFGECVSNQSVCNFDENSQELRRLNEEKEAINERISKIQLKLRELK